MPAKITLEPAEGEHAQVKLLALRHDLLEAEVASLTRRLEALRAEVALLRVRPPESA